MHPISNSQQDALQMCHSINNVHTVKQLSLRDGDVVCGISKTKDEHQQTTELQTQICCSAFTLLVFMVSGGKEIERQKQGN